MKKPILTLLALLAGVWTAVAEDGEIEIVKDESGKLVWKCPKCGNADESKLNVARRTCGYIGSQFWSQGRTQEIKECALHVS